LLAHSHHLTANSQTQVTLEGHADERGTREYNLALGEQRALAVKQFLMDHGVAETQLQTLSYGEERPANAGSNESAWELNRRVELAY
jgi:peptidoglycan-associated lipoprotein